MKKYFCKTFSMLFMFMLLVIPAADVFASDIQDNVIEEKEGWEKVETTTLAITNEFGWEYFVEATTEGGVCSGALFAYFLDTNFEGTYTSECGLWGFDITTSHPMVVFYALCQKQDATDIQSFSEPMLFATAKKTFPTGTSRNAIPPTINYSRAISNSAYAGILDKSRIMMLNPNRPDNPGWIVDFSGWIPVVGTFSIELEEGSVIEFGDVTHKEIIRGRIIFDDGDYWDITPEDNFLASIYH